MSASLELSLSRPATADRNGESVESILQRIQFHEAVRSIQTNGDVGAREREESRRFHETARQQRAENINDVLKGNGKNSRSKFLLSLVRMNVFLADRVAAQRGRLRPETLSKLRPSYAEALQSTKTFFMKEKKESSSQPKENDNRSTSNCFVTPCTSWKKKTETISRYSAKTSTPGYDFSRRTRRWWYAELLALS